MRYVSQRSLRSSVWRTLTKAFGKPLVVAPLSLYTFVAETTHPSCASIPRTRARECTHIHTHIYARAYVPPTASLPDRETPRDDVSSRYVCRLLDIVFLLTTEEESVSADEVAVKFNDLNSEPVGIRAAPRNNRARQRVEYSGVKRETN